MKYLALLLALAGCANIPADPTRMSAEQLRELVKDRSASAACTIVNSPWGVGRAIYIQLDQKTIINGTVTVDAECKTTINSTQKIEAPQAEPQARTRASELKCYPGNSSGSVVVCEPAKQ